MRAPSHFVRGIAAALLIVLAAGGAAFFWRDIGAWVAGDGESGGDVMLYCAANFRTAVDEIVAAYEQETGARVSIQYGGTVTLLTMIRLAKRGDLFLAADDLAIEQARELNLVAEVMPVARQQLVVGVKAGNPLGIRSLDDLLHPDIKVGVCNPEASAAGRIAERVLGERWKEIAAHAAVHKPTVTDLGTDLMLGTIDAALVWDSTVAQLTGVEMVRLDALNEAVALAAVAVLAASENRAGALRFARYLTAPAKGGKTLRANGFFPEKGDAWEETPPLPNVFEKSERAQEAFSERDGMEATTRRPWLARRGDFEFRWRGEELSFPSSAAAIPPWLDGAAPE